MAQIIIENLSFQYPNRESFAIKNISLTIESGDFIIICGRSGCGKTTLLKHLKKQIQPFGIKEGKIFIGGKDIENMSSEEAVTSVGYLYQNPDGQIVTDKVWHELAFGLENLNLDNSKMKRRIGEMASYFGIQNWFELDTNQLSGGQKQILNLASIMVMKPKVLVLDEPTSQLDPIKAKEFIYMLSRINKDFGTTIVMSEHRLEEPLNFATKIAIMDEGQLVAYDEPRKIHNYLDNKAVDNVFSGFPAMMQIFKDENINLLPIDVKEGKKLLSQMDIERKNHVYDKDRKTFLREKNSRIAMALENCWFKYERDGSYFLKGLEVKVIDGEILSILGGNGSGKSTLLKVMAGELKNQRGRVIRNKKSLALVPQNPESIFTELTTGDELYEGVKNNRALSAEQKVEKVIEMLKLMDLYHLVNSNPFDLSGGEKQRLAIGKLLLTETEIILLDEPTKGLDSFFKEKLGKMLQAIKEQGKTVLLVSHDIEFCANYSDRCSMFFNGELIGTHESREFFKGNNFYTTTANRLFRDINNDVVTVKEAKEWITEKH